MQRFGSEEITYSENMRQKFCLPRKYEICVTKAEK